MKIFEQIINGIQIACAAWMPIAAIVSLSLAYLGVGIKEGYSQSYAIGYCWVFLALSIAYDIVMAVVTRKAKEMAR